MATRRQGRSSGFFALVFVVAIAAYTLLAALGKDIPPELRELVALVIGFAGARALDR